MWEKHGKHEESSQSFLHRRSWNSGMLRYTLFFFLLRRGQSNNQWPPSIDVSDLRCALALRSPARRTWRPSPSRSWWRDTPTLWPAWTRWGMRETEVSGRGGTRQITEGGGGATLHFEWKAEEEVWTSPPGGVQREHDQAGSHQEPVGGGGVDRRLERQVRVLIKHTHTYQLIYYQHAWDKQIMCSI